MKNLLSLLRNVSKKRLIPVIALAAAAAVPAVIMAWGPSRATFTVEHPSDHIAFNSITNNPNVGDERNFVTLKDASNTNAGGWQDSVNAVPGKEYLVRVYVHNNAATSLNLKATNTRVKVALPTNTAKQIDFTGYVSADNASPRQVWDDAAFKSTSDFNIAYVPGSAILYNNATGQTGRAVSDSIVTSAGAPVGFNANDGVWPGCFNFAGYITLKVKVQGPPSANFTMEKTVRKAGTTAWQKSVPANPGDTLQYRIKYTNSGQTQQNNVTVSDTLPSGVSYINGSSMFYNTLSPNGVKASDNVTKGGINIGSYATASTAYVRFDAKVTVNSYLPVCGPNKIHNVASVETDFGKKSDSADVTVTKVCVPPAAKFVCSGLNVSTISRTQFTFKANATIQNADFVKFNYVVKDQAGKQVASIDGNNTQAAAYSQSKDGKYTVQAFLTVKVAGVNKTVTSADCVKTFEVKPLPPQPVKPVFACESLKLIQKVSRDTFTFKVTPKTAGNNVSVKEYMFDFGDNQTARVGLGQETQTHTYKTPGTYTTTVSIDFNVDGKTVTGVTSKDCKVTVVVEKVPSVVVPPVTPVTPVTPVIPATPGTPANIPSTGPIDVVAGLFGTTSLGYGIHAFLNSRRAFRSSFKG